MDEYLIKISNQVIKIFYSRGVACGVAAYFKTVILSFPVLHSAYIIQINTNCFIH